MNNKEYFRVLCFTFLVFFSSGIQNAFGSVDRIIAVVNDAIITESELTDSAIFPHQTLSSVIEKKLLLQLASKKGISVSPSEITAAINDIKNTNYFLSDEDFEKALSKQGFSMETYQNDLREQLTIIKLVNKEVKSKITLNDKELEAYYSSNRNLFSQPEEIRVGYVLISVNPDDTEETEKEKQLLIEEIHSDIRNNNRSLAYEKDKYRDKQEISVVEDLGFIKKGQLLREIDTIAFSLAEGDVSNVILTPSGFYLIKVLEKKGVEYKPFNDIKELVKEKVFLDKNDQLFKEWIYEMKTSAYIEIKTN